MDGALRGRRGRMSARRRRRREREVNWVRYVGGTAANDEVLCTSGPFLESMSVLAG